MSPGARVVVNVGVHRVAGVVAEVVPPRVDRGNVPRYRVIPEVGTLKAPCRPESLTPIGGPDAR